MNGGMRRTTKEPETGGERREAFAAFSVSERRFQTPDSPSVAPRCVWPRPSFLEVMYYFITPCKKLQVGGAPPICGGGAQGGAGLLINHRCTVTSWPRPLLGVGFFQFKRS